MAVSDIAKEEYDAVWRESRGHGVKTQEVGGVGGAKEVRRGMRRKRGRPLLPESTPAARQPPAGTGNRNTPIKRLI